MTALQFFSTTARRSTALRRGSIFVLIALLVFAALPVGAGAAQRKQPARITKQAKKPPILSPVDTAQDIAERLREDVEGRLDWFTFKRAYPFNAMPPDARRRAWASRPRARQREGVTPREVQAWQPIGPWPTVSGFMINWGLTSGRINAVAVSPNDPNVVLVGASTGGIWRSADGGLNFAPVSDDHVDITVGALAFAPSDSNIVYAGMGDSKSVYLGTGVLRSDDGGQTWRRVSNETLPARGSAAKIIVDPRDPNRLFVALAIQRDGNSRRGGGIFLSTDGGVNWTRKWRGFARDVAFDVADPNIVYAGMRFVEEPDNRPAGLYRSTDGGETWTNIYATPYDPQLRTGDVRFGQSPANPQRLYVYTGGFIGNQFDVRVVVSNDGGATWQNRGSDGFDTGQFGYNTYLVVDPNDANTLYLGSRDVYKSSDGGRTWGNLTKSFTRDGSGYRYTPRSSSAHPDQHAFAFVPDRPNSFFIGNDGGLYRTDDGGRTFVSRNASLSLTQFVGMSMHPSDPSVSYGGTQDNGTQRRGRLTMQWQEFISGDGGNSVVNPLVPDMVFTTYIRGTIFRFRDNGFAFEKVIGTEEIFGEPPSSPRIAFYPPFVGNGVDNTLYFGTWRLFISTDNGESWRAPGGKKDLTRGIGPPVDVLSAIGVSPSNTQVIYTGSNQGRAMVSTNGGKKWRDITAGLPNRSITDITVDPVDPMTAYLTVSGFGSGHVFKTVNGGESWIDLSNNLPDVPVNDLLIHPYNRDVLLIGTDIGVFRSTDGGASWEDFNQGMPPVVVTALVAHASNGTIQAATYGRGAFELPGEGPPGPPEIAAAVLEKKLLTISGLNFIGSPRVFINDADLTAKIRSISFNTIQLKGKPKKLKLVTGENTIRVAGPNGESNVFTLVL